MDITVVNIPQQRFEQLFFAFDVNMDGYIDQSELNTLIHKSHSLFDTLTLESFGSLIVALSIVMDTNSDLLISYSEVLSLFGAY
jgi:Ca2+-binding EF-hand superfamily protein